MLVRADEMRLEQLNQKIEQEVQNIKQRKISQAEFESMGSPAEL